MPRKRALCRRRKCYYLKETKRVAVLHQDEKENQDETENQDEKDEKENQDETENQDLSLVVSIALKAHISPCVGVTSTQFFSAGAARAGLTLQTWPGGQPAQHAGGHPKC